MKQPFNFDKHDVEKYIQYELKVMSNMEGTFNYVFEKLKEKKHFLDLDKKSGEIELHKVKADEGKSYNWIAVKSGDVDLIIRTYNTHHTIFTKRNKSRKIGEDFNYDCSRYSAFTFRTNTDGLGDKLHDSYCDNPFIDLNAALPQIIEHCNIDRIQSLWNTAGFIRPEYCEVKNAYDGESIHSVDTMIYCAEELTSKHMELFAQNDMMKTLEVLQAKGVIGEKFERGTVKSISTKFPKEYSEPYYHAIGIEINEGDKRKFHDVYSLTYWYMDAVNKLLGEETAKV